MNPDFISSILLDGLMAAIAATGFAVISNPPKRAIAVSAVLAAVGHAFRFYMQHSWTIDISSATFIAAFTIGMLGVMTAKLVKCPAEIFAFPSLLPMIPGVYAYKTILALMQFMQENQDAAVMNRLIVDICKNGLLHHLFPGHRSSHTPADVQTVELYQASGQRTLTGVSPVLNRLELPGNITGALKAKGVLSRIKSNRRRTAP